MYPYLFSRPSECSATRWAYEKNILPRIVADSRGSSVLDYGSACGELRFILQGDSYLGFDIYNYQFEYKTEAGISFTTDPGELEHARYSFCVSSFVFEYVPNDEEVLKNIYNLLLPGAVFWITVPTNFVKIYEIPAKIYGWFVGRDIYLSGGPGEHFYNPFELQQKLESVGFCECNFVQSSGIFVSFLKIIQLWSRVVLHKILRVFGWKSDGVQARHFIHFCSRAEYNTYKARESANYWDWIAGFVFGLAIFLDKLLPFRWACTEFAIRCKKL